MGGMTSAMVVKLHPFSYQPGHVMHGLVGPEPELFVFDAPPKPLDKHVVHPATFAVHADFDVLFFDGFDPVRIRELRALVGIKNPGLAARPLKRSLEGPKAKRGVHCIADLPGEDRPAMPVHDRHKIAMALRHRDIGDVGAPDFVDLGHFHVAQQVGIFFVRRGWRAC